MLVSRDLNCASYKQEEISQNNKNVQVQVRVLDSGSTIKDLFCSKDMRCMYLRF